MLHVCCCAGCSLQDELRRAEALRREAEKARDKDEREKEKELELIRKQYLVGAGCWGCLCTPWLLWRLLALPSTDLDDASMAVYFVVCSH